MTTESNLRAIICSYQVQMSYAIKALKKETELSQIQAAELLQQKLEENIQAFKLASTK